VKSQTRNRILIYVGALLLVGGLAWAGFVLPGQVPPDIGMQLNSAEILVQVGDYENALKNALGALEQDPEHRYTHIVLGYIYDRMERYDESLDHYGTALDLTADSEEDGDLLTLYRAEVLVKAGRAAEAIREAEGVLDRSPKMPQAFYVIAQAHRAEGRLDEVEAAYREARSVAPEDFEPLVFLAMVREERGALGDALGLLASAGELEPESDLVPRLSARVLAKAERPNEAVESLRAAAALSLARTRRFVRSEPDLEGLRADPRLEKILAGSGAEPAEPEGPEKNGIFPLKSPNGESR